MIKTIMLLIEMDGCDYLQKQDFKMALRKYRKALHYLDICWEKDGIDEGIVF